MRKNHSKIVCIKLVHLPYLYMMHGHAYIKLKDSKTSKHVSSLYQL